MGFACPKCGQKLKVSATRPESGVLTKRYYMCINYRCPVKTVRSYEELEVEPVVFESPVRLNAENCKV